MLEMGSKIGDHYIIKKKIGRGSFGQIFVCVDSHSQKVYAAKNEIPNIRVPQLAYEARIYRLLDGYSHTPRFHGYIHDNESKSDFLILDYLGKSLETIISSYKKLSIMTVLMIADQLLSSIQYLHQKHFIHRDIKPDNFVVGLGDKQNQIFMIDFGLAKKYRDPNSLKHVDYSDGVKLTGTARYASINALNGIEQTRRDDLESLGYVLIYLIKGTLPWIGLNTQPDGKYTKILECKIRTPLEELCSGLPAEFVEYFRSVKSLEFAEEPNYSEYRRMFRELFLRLGYSINYSYEWKRKPERNLSLSSKSHSGSELLGSPLSVKVQCQDTSFAVTADFDEQMNDLKKILNLSSSSLNSSEQRNIKSFNLSSVSSSKSSSNLEAPTQTDSSDGSVGNDFENDTDSSSSLNSGGNLDFSDADSDCDKSLLIGK